MRSDNDRKEIIEEDELSDGIEAVISDRIILSDEEMKEASGPMMNPSIFMCLNGYMNRKGRSGLTLILLLLIVFPQCKCVQLIEYEHHRNSPTIIKVD